jgi:hypothetical protein
MLACCVLPVINTDEEVEMAARDAEVMFTGARRASPSRTSSGRSGPPSVREPSATRTVGTFPAYPVAHLPDIALPVATANAIVENAGRRVDFLHLPVLASSDDAYFAPLADVAPGSAKLFLGLECNDGSEAMQKRIDVASAHLRDYGVAHYCGYLWTREILPQFLADLNTGADRH